MGIYTQKVIYTHLYKPAGVSCQLQVCLSMYDFFRVKENPLLFLTSAIFPKNEEVIHKWENVKHKLKTEKNFHLTYKSLNPQFTTFN